MSYKNEFNEKGYYYCYECRYFDRSKWHNGYIFDLYECRKLNRQCGENTPLCEHFKPSLRARHQMFACNHGCLSLIVQCLIIWLIFWGMNKIMMWMM